MTPESPDEMTRRIRATLDRAAAEPDAELDRRIRAAWQAARPPEAPRRRERWALAGMALAAGVAAIVWLPVRDPAPARVSPVPVMAQAAQMPTVEPEFLDDMELLAAAGEDPDES
jgi:hypothetical protein